MILKTIGAALLMAGAAVAQCDLSCLNISGKLVSPGGCGGMYALLDPFGNDAWYNPPPCDPSDTPDMDWSTFIFDGVEPHPCTHKIKFLATPEMDLTCEENLFGFVTLGFMRQETPLTLPGVSGAFAYSEAAYSEPMTLVCQEPDHTQFQHEMFFAPGVIPPGTKLVFQQVIFGFGTYLPSFAYQVTFP